jgi:hypothetical protein
MKKTLIHIVLLCCLGVQAQILIPYQPVQKQPLVQLDYWVYSTNAGNGTATQYPVVPLTLADMDKLFNSSNSHTTLIQSGKTNSTRILDWTSAAELTPLGINLPNSANYFAFKIQGTFIPLETGNYTFTLETDDANDLYINGSQLIGNYAGQAVPALGTHTATMYMTAGKLYSFQIRMQQGAGGYGLRFYWKSPVQNSAPSSYSSVLPASTYFPSWTQNLQELVSEPVMDGSSAAKAAPSAKYLQTAFGNYTDGVYWINLPYVGPTQVYCLLNPAVNGGGWMMAMKATRGTTFPYSSAYWTGVNTLYPAQTNRNDGDAKFDTMNYYHAKDIMALWPDIPWNYGGSSTGGSVNTNGSYYVWCWLQNNFNNGIRITPINFFSQASNLFFGDSNNFTGKGTAFSSQVDVRFYGFNYTGNGTGTNRWGFGWNENGGGLYPNGNQQSNDVYTGIGMAYGNYSAGDFIGCCQDVTGINRSARFEIYIR